MIAEMSWIRVDSVNRELGVDYRDNFVLSSLSADDVNVWWMNILLLSMLAMFWPAFALFGKTVSSRFGNADIERPMTSGVNAIAFILLLSLFMATPLSRPIWNAVHSLQQTQFPWRWFAITSVAGPMLLALCIPFWKRMAKTGMRSLVMIACGTIAISIAFSAGQIIREARWLTPAQFSELLTSIPGSASVNQWTPIWVHGKTGATAPVDAGDRRVTVDNWSAEIRKFHVDSGNATEARVATFFYPHWTASVEGKALAIRPDQSGALTISLPRESADVTLEFREPARSRYAAGLTAIGWAFVAGLFVNPRRRFPKTIHLEN
jgi:hypothetical protein